MRRILVSFPGKLGDLVYSLPAVRALGAALEAEVHYQTAPYCRAALTLLQAQSWLAGARVAEDYRLDHTHYGCQPWLMPEPSGFDRIFHLGFRPELLGRAILSVPLIDNFYYTLRKIYGLDPDRESDRPYIEAPGFVSGEYVAVQGYGQTLMDMMDRAAQDILRTFWWELLAGLGREAVILAGPGDESFYLGWPGQVVQPDNLLETARIIAGAKCFLGVQSVGAALADGLKVPRLILAWFRNALPRGPGAMTFSLDADPREVVAGLKRHWDSV